MTPTIEARALVKSYGSTRALDGLDLVAEPGQVLAGLGPNGAGKTTFVRAVATLLRLDSGTLRVAGHDVTREPDEVRRAIGLAGQFAAVEPAMTARENQVLAAHQPLTYMVDAVRALTLAARERVARPLELVLRGAGEPLGRCDPRGGGPTGNHSLPPRVVLYGARAWSVPATSGA